MADNSQMLYQLKTAMSQLRSDMTDAFGDQPRSEAQYCHMPDVGGMSLSIEDELKKSNQALKLTEHLLLIKESQLKEETSRNECLRASLALLVEILYAVIDGEYSVKWMLDAFTRVISTGNSIDSSILWTQKGEKYSISTAGMEADKGEAMFRSLLSDIVDAGLNNPCVTVGGTHYMLFTHSVKGAKVSVIHVLVFVRDGRHLPFSSDDALLAHYFAKVIFRLISSFGKYDQ